MRRAAIRPKRAREDLLRASNALMPSTTWTNRGTKTSSSSSSSVEMGGWISSPLATTHQRIKLAAFYNSAGYYMILHTKHMRFRYFFSAFVSFVEIVNLIST